MGYCEPYPPFEQGEIVRMNPGISNHDIVRGVSYEIIGITESGSLTLRVLNDPYSEIFVRRTPTAFHRFQEPGPW